MWVKVVRCGECEYARSFPFAIFVTLYSSTAYTHCNFQMKYALLEYKNYLFNKSFGYLDIIYLSFYTNYLFNLFVWRIYCIFVMWECVPTCNHSAL